MKKLIILLTLTGLSCSQTASAQKENSGVGQLRGRKLVWHDEFNYTGLPSSKKWSYDTGKSGWGNNELQFYTAGRIKNASVANGVLAIKAIKETFKGAGYTSARLLTKSKASWKYGRVEVRAKLPYGKGIWPAIWMLSDDRSYGDWPNSGEIDIMENVGYNPDSVFASIHTGSYNHTIGTQRTKGVSGDNLSTAFHVYTLEWTEKQIRIFIDDENYFQFNNEGAGGKVWPFDKKFHLLLNLAVGGNWGGKMGIDDGIFPQVMEVDYVRVYR